MVWPVQVCVCEQKKKKKGVEEAHEKDEAQTCLLVRAIAHPSHRSHCSYGVARAGVRVSNRRRRRRRALKKRTRKTKPRPACWFVPLRILLIVLIVLMVWPVQVCV
jgi:hypothetical protein